MPLNKKEEVERGSDQILLHGKQNNNAKEGNIMRTTKYVQKNKGKKQHIDAKYWLENKMNVLHKWEKLNIKRTNKKIMTKYQQLSANITNII